MPSLLVIDDDPLVLECLDCTFTGPEVSLATATTAAEGLARFTAARPDAVLVDLRLPDVSGLEVFRRLHDLDPRVPVILMTGFGTASTAIEAMQLGAYEYLVKPLDLDQLTDLVTRAFEIRRLMRVPARVADTAEAAEADPGADLLIGRAPAMQEVFKAIGRVAPQDVTVLIRGESGTGKELVARAIYHHGHRAGGPFLAINAAAIPETLLEAELFGHEKGSFTGADRRRIGKFEQCSGGTLFLDEIGDMTPLTQTKVLRVLQDQQFERVGGNDPIRTDVRLIAATNRDLEGMMADGRFRADLYYRLNVYTIHLPPLRERPEDLPLLADHYLRRFSQELNKEMLSVSPEAMDLLERYSWPGNVRELQSILKQAILVATGPVLVPEFLPVMLRGEGAASPASVRIVRGEGDGVEDALRSHVRTRLHEEGTDLYDEIVGMAERIMLGEILDQTGHNQSQTARILGITRATLRAKMAAHGIAIERTATVLP